MSHIILINAERDQVETHQVDADLFLKVWDLLHQTKADDVLDGLAFGAAAAMPAVKAAIEERDTYHPASDPQPIVYGDPLGDAMANSTDEEPELEPAPAPEPAPTPTAPANGDAAFAASLASLFAR